MSPELPEPSQTPEPPASEPSQTPQPSAPTSQTPPPSSFIDRWNMNQLTVIDKFLIGFVVVSLLAGFGYAIYSWAQVSKSSQAARDDIPIPTKSKGTDPRNNDPSSSSFMSAFESDNDASTPYVMPPPASSPSKYIKARYLQIINSTLPVEKYWMGIAGIDVFDEKGNNISLMQNNKNVKISKFSGALFNYDLVYRWENVLDGDRFTIGHSQPQYTYIQQTATNMWDSNASGEYKCAAQNRNITGNNGDFANYCIFDTEADVRNWCSYASSQGCVGYVSENGNKFQALTKDPVTVTGKVSQYFTKVEKQEAFLVEIDLGAMYNISKIIVTNREAWRGRILGSQILLTNTPGVTDQAVYTSEKFAGKTGTNTYLPDNTPDHNLGYLYYVIAMPQTTVQGMNSLGSQQARYIQMINKTMPNKSYMNLLSISVFDVDDNLVSSDPNVKISKILGGTFPNSDWNNVLKKDNTTRCASAEINETNPQFLLEIDLGKVYDLARIEIRNRTDSWDGRIVGSQIQLFVDNTAASPVYLSERFKSRQGTNVCIEQNAVAGVYGFPRYIIDLPSSKVHGAFTIPIQEAFDRESDYNGFIKFSSMDMPEGDMQSISLTTGVSSKPVSSMADCTKLCRDDPACTGFVYARSNYMVGEKTLESTVDAGGRKCYIKNNTAKHITPHIFCDTFLKTPVYRKGTWTCVAGLTTPLRINSTTNNPECLSLNGTNCMWQSTFADCVSLLENIPATINPVPCGDPVETGTGYMAPNHWCRIARRALSYNNTPPPP